MAFEIAMPQMGVTMESGTVSKWLKRVGDAVRKEEPVAEIETDKVTIEVTSDVEGVLLEIAVPEGKEVPVGTVLAWVGQAGEATPGKDADTGSIDLPGDRPPVPAPGIASPGGRVRATPAARARARSYGIDLAALPGTGLAGRIHVRDVEAARSVGTTPSVAPASAVTYRDLPVAGARKVIADRMSQSFHRSVPVLLTTEVVMDRAEDLLDQIASGLDGMAGGKVGTLPLVIKAAGYALQRHPGLNAHWLGDTIRRFEGEINIGVAVSLEDGLTVPVLKQADRKSVSDIAAEVGTLAARARQNSLLLADLEGGTFTVSNLGGYGVGFFMPVINPPQVAILGIGRTVPKPVVRDGEVRALPVLPLSLVFDHRAIDGAPAAAFLDAIRTALEKPYLLLT